MNRFINANGIRLHYLDYRRGEALNEPVLILLPGLTANANAFDGLIEGGLSDQFGALALDLRGRGQSEKPATGYSMAEHAADVVGLLDELAIARAIIAGHSFGGILSVYLAANFPDRFTHLIVLDAAVKLVNAQTLELIKPSLARLGQRWPSWEHYLESMKKAPYFDQWWDPTIESYFRADVEFQDDGSVAPRSRPENIAEVVQKMSREDWDRHLAAVKQPSLLVCAHGPCGPAGSSALVSPEQARATADAMNGARLREVQGNHFTMLYGPSARNIVDYITEFVGERRVAKG